MTRGNSNRLLLRQILVISLIGLLLLFLSKIIPFGPIILWLEERVVQYSPWSLIVYPLLVACCNFLLLPGSVLVVASGFFFGFFKGFTLVIIGNLLGAAAAFYIARAFSEKWKNRFFEKRPAWKAWDIAIEEEGWKIVFLTQINPLAPTSLLNYIYGLTRIKSLPCFLGIALGQTPGILLYVYLGKFGNFAWKANNANSEAMFPILNSPTIFGFNYGQVLFWGMGFIFSLFLTQVLGRIATRIQSRFANTTPSTNHFS